MDKSCEPMDVDLSANSVTGMDISYNEDTQGDLSLGGKDFNEPLTFKCNSISLDPNVDQPRFIKVYHIHKKIEKRTIPNIFIILPCVAVACISIIIYQVLNVECNSGLNSAFFKDKLDSKLYGQNAAVDDIISAIDKEAKSKILFFYGGTGVGKTYTISLLLENAWNYSNVYHYTMPTFVETFSTDVMLGLTICKTATFVVDDITINDVDKIKSHAKNILQKSEGLEKSITIILVFNCHSADNEFMTTCDDNFEAEVSNSFVDINTFKTFVKFKPLTTDHLKRCIKDELRVKHIDENVLKSIIKNFNVSIDGCKGVYQKIKTLNFA